MPMRIIGKTKIDFIGMRKISFIISSVLVLAGIFALVSLLTGGGNMGIEFVGGTMVQGNFDKPVEIAQLRSVMNEAGFEDATIQELQHDVANSVVIRTKVAPGQVDTRIRIEDALATGFPNNSFHLDSAHEVGPAVGAAGVFGLLLFRFHGVRGEAALAVEKRAEPVAALQDDRHEEQDLDRPARGGDPEPAELRPLLRPVVSPDLPLDLRHETVAGRPGEDQALELPLDGSMRSSGICGATRQVVVWAGHAASVNCTYS